MTAQDALAALVARTDDEIALIGSGDLEALEAATRAKLAALEPLRRADPAALAAALPAHAVDHAAKLNREAARLVNAARARVDRRLSALARAVGRAPAAAYGPDARLTTRMLRP